MTLTDGERLSYAFEYNGDCTVQSTSMVGFKQNSDNKLLVVTNSTIC